MRTFKGAAAGAAGLEYVNRGDPAVYDALIGDVTADSTWRDLALGEVVTDSDAELIHRALQCQDDSAGKVFFVREDGNTHGVNALRAGTPAANVSGYADGFVPCSSGRTIEYYISSGMDAIYLTVRGWWKPAA